MALVQKEIRNFKSERQELSFLSDFTVIVDGDQFKTHKAILAYRSEYFKAMLSHDTIESQKSQVEIKDVKPEIMQNILEYFYTSKLNINLDNLQDLLEAGTRFQLDSILLLCDDFLLGVELDTVNCTGIFSTAYRFGIDDIV